MGGPQGLEQQVHQCRERLPAAAVTNQARPTLLAFMDGRNCDLGTKSRTTSRSRIVRPGNLGDYLDDNRPACAVAVDRLWRSATTHKRARHEWPHNGYSRSWVRDGG